MSLPFILSQTEKKSCQNVKDEETFQVVLLPRPNLPSHVLLFSISEQLFFNKWIRLDTWFLASSVAAQNPKKLKERDSFAVVLRSLSLIQTSQLILSLKTLFLSVLKLFWCSKTTTNHNSGWMMVMLTNKLSWSIGVRWCDVNKNVTGTRNSKI